MKVIQISGVGRVGKTTLASLIAEYAVDQGFIPLMVPFAKALKEEAAELGYNKDDNPEEYRKFCQKHGAGRREEDPDYWVKKARIEIEKAKLSELERRRRGKRTWEHLILQDDVRYMNELAYGRDIGAYQIFVTPFERMIMEENDPWRHHESERLANLVEAGDRRYTDVFHEYVINDKSIPKLNTFMKKHFFTWISDPDPCSCALCTTYRSGLVPNVKFLNDDLYDEFFGEIHEDFDDDYDEANDSDT